MVRQLRGWLLALVSILAISVIADAQGGYGWRSVENGTAYFWGTTAAPKTNGAALGATGLLWVVPDDAYAAGWDGSANIPTKNAVYDKVQAVISTIPTTHVIGVAAGYKIARGTTALDGSNPTTVATGLSTVVSCTATLIRTTGLDAGTAEVTHAAPSGANVDFYGWVILGTASTGTESFDWVCVGT